MAHSKEQRRRYLAANRDQTRLAHFSWRHGPGIHIWLVDTWKRQEGRCYLRERPMARDQAFIDHDHMCCPQIRSCPDCRRGLACERCNLLIGKVDDDPDLLRLIAANLESALRLTRDRIARKPIQASLEELI